jgi:hypothetical protein
MRVEHNLALLGAELRDSPHVTKTYVTSLLDKYHIYVSGIHVQCPSHLFYEGNIIGKQMSVDELQACAWDSLVNQLSVLKKMVEDLDYVDRIMKVVYYINGVGSKEQWKEATRGTSSLLEEAFGKSGEHESCVIAPVPLPPAQPVQVDILVSVPAAMIEVPFFKQEYMEGSA